MNLDDEIRRLRLTPALPSSKFRVIRDKKRICTMDIKKRPNHRIYIQALRRMSPEERLLKAFELSEFAKQLFIHGLRERFPNLPEEEFRKILMERLDKCHNRNY